MKLHVTLMVETNETPGKLVGRLTCAIPNADCQVEWINVRGENKPLARYDRLPRRLPAGKS